MVFKANGIRTVSFPNISKGIYRFPKRKAAEIEMSAVIDYVRGHATFEHIQFVCFDEENLNIYESIMKEYAFV